MIYIKSYEVVVFIQLGHLPTEHKQRFRKHLLLATWITCASAPIVYLCYAIIWYPKQSKVRSLDVTLLVMQLALTLTISVLFIIASRLVSLIRQTSEKTQSHHSEF